MGGEGVTAVPRPCTPEEPVPFPHFLSWGAQTIMLALDVEGWFSAVFIYEYMEGFLS